MVIESGMPLLAQDMLDLTFFPVGAILMYDGTNWINGRGGWYVCDGTNGTPDLSDKFIMGNSKTGQPKESGANFRGLSEKNLPNHTHTGSAADAGSHTHVIQVGGMHGKVDGWYSVDRVWHFGQDDGIKAVTQGAGSHSHTLTINSVGSGTEFDNRPAYHALIYIKKMTGNNI
jgi:hypothetical protein